jgi:hypothetical protein
MGNFRAITGRFRAIGAGWHRVWMSWPDSVRIGSVQLASPDRDDKAWPRCETRRSAGARQRKMAAATTLVKRLGFSSAAIAIIVGLAAAAPGPRAVTDTSPKSTTPIAGLAAAAPGLKDVADTSPESTTPAVIKAFDAWEEPSIMTLAWFQEAYQAGFRVFVVQDDTVLTSATNASTQAIVQAAEAAGLQVGAFTCSPEDYAAGISAFGGLPMAFFAFDVEPGNGPGGSNCNGSGSTIVPVTSAEVAAVEADGIRPVIYSYPYGWQGGSGFTNIPLWASQDNSRTTLKNWVPSLTSPPFSPTFGGWTQSDLMAMQNVWLSYNGVMVDLDSMSASY